MSNRIETYVHQSLAGAGFAVLDHTIAAMLRPDLWGNGNGGMEAAWEFGRAENMLNGLQGVRRFFMRLEGSARDIPVVARSSEYLATRIEWTLGRAVLDLVEVTKGKPTAALEPAKARVQSAGLDRFHEIKTAEPGRTCSHCDHLTAGHACRKASETRLDHPAANVQHRCLWFTPQWNATDSRTGRQLWPELVNQEVGHAA